MQAAFWEWFLAWASSQITTGNFLREYQLTWAKIVPGPRYLTWYRLIYCYNHSHSCLAALLAVCAAFFSGQVAQIKIGLKCRILDDTWRLKLENEQAKEAKI